MKFKYYFYLPNILLDRWKIFVFQTFPYASPPDSPLLDLAKYIFLFKICIKGNFEEFLLDNKE